MGFTYKTITANCGDSDFGVQTTFDFCDQIKKSQCDFYILNLQEAEYSNIERQLNETLSSKEGPNYFAMLTASMNTLTKPSLKSSGIANIIIYNADKLDVCVDKSQICRRNFVEGYNKGGTATSVHLIKKDVPAEEVKILCLSGHLDSNRPDKRAEDWKNLLKLSSVNADNWETLATQLPHLIASGIDCNTRDILDQQDSPIWLTQHEEVQGFNQFPIGNIRFSSRNTYIPKSSVKEQKASKYHAQGYELSGSLDIIAILSSNLVNYEFFDTDLSQVIPTIEEHARDHLIIFSYPMTVETLTDFENVRNHLYIRINKVAPTLANEIYQLENNSENQERVRHIYQVFFQDNGLMEQLINLYQLKLCEFKDIKSSRRSPLVIDEIRQRFFHNTPWLDSLCLENLEASIPRITEYIEHETDNLRNPKEIKTLEELKLECIETLSQYEKSKSSIVSFSFNRQAIFTKAQEIQKTITDIASSESVAEISGAIETLKQQPIFSSQKKLGKLSELIMDCEKLITRTHILNFENTLEDLKTYIIHKFDQYQITPKDNPIKNAAKLQEKEEQCHTIIENVHHASSVADIYLTLHYFHAEQEKLLRGSGKFKTIFDECFNQAQQCYQKLQGIESTDTPKAHRK